MRLLPCLLATLLVSACAGPATDPTAPPPPDDVEAWNARFPQGRWVRAWGESTRSARQASLDARGQVAERMSSSITSESSSLARAVMRDTDVSDFQELQSEVRTTSTFHRAEMIRVVEPTAHEDGGTFRVLAVLDRNEVARAIQLEYDEVAAAWRPGASLHGPLPEWTAGWHRSREQFPRLLATAAESQAVSGLYPAGFTQDRARWEAIHASRDSVLRATEIVVELAPFEGIDATELAERLSAGFSRLGITARAGVCAGRDTSLRLRPRIESRQVIGEVLQLQLEGTIGRCEGAPWSEVAIAGSAMRGAGRDPASDLLRNMTPEAVASLLAESLGHVLPL